MDITFEVPGQPVPQPRVRVSTWGGRGRAYTPAKHPIHAYRQAVQIRAALALKQTKAAAWAGPVALEAEFVFARPASHWTKGGLARAAPAFPGHVGDVDNLVKGLADGLTSAGVWADDDQVVELVARKRYSARREPARTIVSIRRLADGRPS